MILDILALVAVLTLPVLAVIELDAYRFNRDVEQSIRLTEEKR